jgi:hypothetical protein
MMALYYALVFLCLIPIFIVIKSEFDDANEMMENEIKPGIRMVYNMGL